LHTSHFQKLKPEPLLYSPGCFGGVDGCGCRASVGDSKQTIEFDYAKQVLTLREYQALYCACEWHLVHEQQLPFERVHGFKCVASAAIGLDSRYVAVLAVKRLLVPNSTKKTRFVPDAASRAPPYSWPFFVDRAIFEGGDLLLLSAYQSDAERGTAKNLNNIVVEKALYVSADAEKLRPIVDALNARLSQADEA
jgi:hypothetical protein